MSALVGFHPLTESYDKQASLYHEPVYRARRDMLTEQLDEVYDGLKKQQVDNLMAQQHKVMEATMNAQLPDLLTSGKENTWERVCVGLCRCSWRLCPVVDSPVPLAQVSKVLLAAIEQAAAALQPHVQCTASCPSRPQLRHLFLCSSIICLHSFGMPRGHVGAVAREPVHPGFEPHAPQCRAAAQYSPLDHAQKVRLYLFTVLLPVLSSSYG